MRKYKLFQLFILLHNNELLRLITLSMRWKDMTVELFLLSPKEEIKKTVGLEAATDLNFMFLARSAMKSTRYFKIKLKSYFILFYSKQSLLFLNY